MITEKVVSGKKKAVSAASAANSAAISAANAAAVSAAAANPAALLEFDATTGGYKVVDAAII
jgi:hypothetical protein